MADLLDKATEKFERSCAHLVKFLDDWIDKIAGRCAQDEQQRAAFFIWSRYTMSIRTLQRICDPHLMPDIYLIGRACIEFDASLKAVTDDPEQAHKYLQFEDAAAAYLGKLFKRHGYTDDLGAMESRLKEALGPDWEKSARAKWCNMREIIVRYAGPEERIGYAWWSHFAHGSVVAIESLRGIAPTQRRLDQAMAVIYNSYLMSTSDFLDFIWGHIVTADSDRCKKEFETVMASNIRGVH